MTQEHQETPLEDVLDNQGPAEPQEPVEEQQAEPIAEQPAQEPVAEPEPETETETEVKPNAPTVPLAALHEVRDANKAIKAELEALKAAQMPQQQEQPEAIPDPVLEPEKFHAYQAKQQERLAQGMQGELLQQKVGMSRFQYAQEHGDGKAQELVDWFGQQPAHVQDQARQHPHPFAFAHELKQTAELTAQMSNPETRQQFEAFLASQNNPSQAAPRAPATTAGARNVSARSGPAWTGPTPLEQILDQ